MLFVKEINPEIAEISACLQGEGSLFQWNSQAKQSIEHQLSKGILSAQ